MQVVLLILGIVLLAIILKVLISGSLLKLKLNKVQKLIHRLDSKNHYHLVFEKTSEINAAATLDGGRRILILSKGALKLFTIPELAFVLGHEVGHHQLGHTGIFNLYSKIAGGSFVEAIRPKGFMESIGFTSMRNEPIWWKILSKGMEVFTFQAYQRDEYAADKRGVELMTSLGYDRAHARSALDNLKYLDPDRSGFDKIITKYFGQRKHPFLNDRIARI